MIVKCHMIVNENGTRRFGEVPFERVVFNESAVIGIDGSTTNSGISIVRERDGVFIASLAFTRDKDNESAVRYKVALKKKLSELIDANIKYVKHIYYEEPFIGHTSAIPNLMMMRTSVEELKIENEPRYDMIAYSEMPNMMWKKVMLEPEKVPAGTENQKKAIKNKIIKDIPLFSCLTQDELDAFGIAYAAVWMNNHGDSNVIERGKLKPFKYSAQFFAFDSDTEMNDNIFEEYNGPQSILVNGIKLYYLENREDFEKALMYQMENDDKLVILKFDSMTHGNIVLKHKVGHLLPQGKYLYAMCWRNKRL